MLPGTGGQPRFYRLILRTGAARGLHAIGLSYPNDRAVDDLCGAGAVASCSGETRREIITGIDASPAVTVDPANSINGRLQALLVWLHATNPSEGWNRFCVLAPPIGRSSPLPAIRRAPAMPPVWPSCMNLTGWRCLPAPAMSARQSECRRHGSICRPSRQQDGNMVLPIAPINWCPLPFCNRTGRDWG